MRVAAMSLDFRRINDQQLERFKFRIHDWDGMLTRWNYSNHNAEIDRFILALNGVEQDPENGDYLSLQKKEDRLRLDLTDGPPVISGDFDERWVLHRDGRLNILIKNQNYLW